MSEDANYQSNEPLKDLNALIPALGIRARLGMSPKELRLIYEKKTEGFRKRNR